MFRTALGDALLLAGKSTVPKTRAAKGRAFTRWITFCRGLNVDPSLRGILGAEDRLSYLLVYGIQLRRNGQAGQPIRSDTVSNILLAVGEGITDMGEPDPRQETPGQQKYHPIFAAFLKAMRDEDSPATRSYPVNTTILRRLPVILDFADVDAGQANRTTTDLCVVGFYWLLRPVEYLASSGEGRSQAFRLCDIYFTIHGRVWLATDPTLSLNDETVLRITHAQLTFTDQKSGVPGEQIGHQATSDPLLCPCKALGRIAQHLRRFSAPPDTPIHTFYHGGQTETVPPEYVTNALRHAAQDIQTLTGIDPRLLSARSLRPGGATALLCAGVDPNNIKLLGRWRSDSMLVYLRIHAAAHTKHFAQRMLDAGAYTFAPGTYDLPDANPIQMPATVADLLDMDVE